MQLGSSVARDSPSSIVLVIPLERSCLKICLWVAALIALAFLLSLSSIKLAILIVTTLSIGLYYLVWTHSKLVSFCFYSQRDRNSENVTHFAIFDASSQGGEGRVYIVKVHYKRQNINFFHFNEILFKVLDQTVEVANQIDLLNMIKIQRIEQYKMTGLDKERIEVSKSLYGKQKGLITPSWWQMTLRRVRQDKQWMILMLIALVTALLWNWPVLLVLLIINLVSAVILYIEQHRSAVSFAQRYGWIARQQYRVIREGEEHQIAFQQILVGDVVVLSKDEQNEQQMIYFKSLLITNQHQIIVKQGEAEVVKLSLKDGGSYTDRAHLDKCIIAAQSTIQNLELSTSQYLVVADNQSISRFFSLWFQKSERQHSSPLFKDKQKHILYLAMGYAVFLVVLCVVLKIAAGTFAQQFDSSVTDQIFLCVLALPSVIYLLLCFNSLLAYLRLADSKIEVFGNRVQESGLVNNLLLNFSDLVTLEMSQVLTKYQIFDSSIAPFDPNNQTLQKCASYESLLALILYISLGEFQKSETFLKKVYNGFRERYRYQPSMGGYFDDVIHYGSQKKWQILGYFPDVSSGGRSWLVRYDKKTSYVITEGNFKQGSEVFQALIGSREEKTKIDVYRSTSQTLLEEGKRFKLVFFRTLKDKDRADRAWHEDIRGQDLRTTEFILSYDPKTLDRGRLQKNLEFASFIIFDNAIKKQSIEVIKMLSDYQTQCKKKLLNVAFYSSRGKQTMAGFEHLLTNVPFVYELSQIEKYRLVVRKMKEGGALVIGGREDQLALQAATVSVQIDQNIDEVANRLLVPCDVCLNKLTAITTLLDTGNWMVWIRLQSVKFALLFTMSQIMALLILGTRGDYAVIDHPLLWGIIQQLLFMVMPLIVLNLIPVNSLLCSKSKYNTITITFAIQMFVVLGMIVVLIVSAQPNAICPTYLVEKQDHQMIRLRVHYMQNNEKDCMNIPLIVSATSGVILFSIIYLQQKWILSSQELWRYLIIVLWVGVILISNLPMSLFWVGVCLLAVLVMLKYFFKLTVLKPQQP